MGKLWSADNPLTKMINAVSNLIVLNFWWVVCSLPVITMGAATTAAYTVLFAHRQGEYDDVMRPFLRAFKENFKRSTLAWLPILLVIAVLVVDVLVVSLQPQMQLDNLAPVIIIAAVVIGVIVTYLFPQLALFENKIGRMLRNALNLTMLRPLRTLLMLVLNLIPWVMMLAAPYVFVVLLPFWGLLGFSLIGYYCAWILTGIFKKYMPQPQSQEEEG